jgi:energy-coupling factor transporter transmembrane protein EcfT
MDKHLEKSLMIIKDEQLERSLSIVVGGYLFSIGAYLIWCFYFLHGEQFKVDYFFVIGLVFFAITVVYLFSYLLILYIKSFQKVWTSFFFVSIITLLIFFLIPHTNHLIYYKFHDKEKILTEKKRMEKVENKLKFKIAMNDASKKLITELQAKLESERKENERLRKQLDETIRKMTSLEEERETKGDIVAQAKSDKNISKIKINSKMVNTESDTINQEIIFKVQIISSSTRLVKNSPQFNGLKNIWEYKDSGLYKYTVGNQKDLKSAYALQSELRKKGFDGAFVVAFKNGKRITIRDAKKFLTAY